MCISLSDSPHLTHCRSTQVTRRQDVSGDSEGMERAKRKWGGGWRVEGEHSRPGGGCWLDPGLQAVVFFLIIKKKFN